LSRRAGTTYERLAARYLQARGLRRLETNFVSRYGELDLVMEDGTTVVVVEVRRRRGRLGIHNALESVDAGKQRRLVRTAGALLAARPPLRSRPLRFDVVAVGGAGATDDIVWIKDAFGADA
jgi:putative endonuclease